MSTGSAGELEQAQAAYGRAFNRFGLGRPSDTPDVLAEADVAVGHLGAACPASNQPGAAFIAARIIDTRILIGSLRALPDAARSDVATSLMAVDFLLRAVHARCEAKPAYCVSCHSTHLVPNEGGTPEAPLYRCTDCGIVAAYPAS